MIEEIALRDFIEPDSKLIALQDLLIRMGVIGKDAEDFFDFCQEYELQEFFFDAMVPQVISLGCLYVPVSCEESLRIWIRECDHYHMSEEGVRIEAIMVKKYFH